MDLIDQIGAGDREALSQLFKRFARPVRSIGRRILKDEAEADDLVQEVFLYIYRKSNLFDSSKGSARSWIFQVAYTQAFLRRRQLKSRGFYASAIADKSFGVEPATNSGADYEQTVEGLLGRNGWQRILESLSEEQRETLRLHFFEGYTLGAIYRVHWSNIFTLFGCNLSDFDKDQAMFAPPKTQLACGTGQPEETVMLPVQSRPEFRLDRTNLLSRLFEIWGEVPVRFIQHLDLKNGVYGFVGIFDRTLFPIIRPGSIVQIDQDHRRIVPSHWQNEHDRPIYFVELRGEYLCSWCEMHDGYLSAVPHPLSKCQVRRFAYPREAEIVGRVIGVTMPLVEAGEPE